MAKKYYAVRSGRKTGIFTSWDECKRLVTGYKGAAFHGFDSLSDAEAFLLASNGAAADSRKDAATAYVDGSYNIKTKEFSYGAVIFHNGDKLTMSEAFSEPENASMRNVAGEIRGAEKVMRYCIEHNIEKLDLYYDYEGIAKWCTGEWKANKPGTILYKQNYDLMKDRLDVKFIKVKGHSGNKYNDMVDRLAKDALGIK